jgi:6-phosphogluconolactonase (cycloisomerase 2 family)
MLRWRYLTKIKCGAILGAYLITAQCAEPAHAADQTVFAYIGSFTTAQRKAHGQGIEVYRLNGDGGTMTLTDRVGGLVNPSYLILSPEGRFLYASHGDGDYASAFAIDPVTGRAHLLNQAKTGGLNGARATTDRLGRALLVANYSSGNVSVLPIGKDGRLSDAVQTIPLTGDPGPHRLEQTSSHPHDVVFDPSGRYVLVPDKGLDRIFIFHFDMGQLRLSPTAQSSIQTRPGAGPRHAVFHPALPFVWVINELDNTIASYRFDARDGRLIPQQILSTLPADFFTSNTASEIAISPDGRFLYGSNRGHDSIAIYEIDQTSGQLRALTWHSTQGHGPRFFSILAPSNLLLAANEQSDSIIRFRINPANGELSQLGEVIASPTPVSIVFSSN